MSVPQIKASDIVGNSGDNHVTLYDEQRGVPLRYQLRIDSYPANWRMTVEAFARDQLTWNTLWSLVPEFYQVATGPDDLTAVTDPDSRVIASPYNRDAGVKATSWNKIIAELARHVELLLAPIAAARLDLPVGDNALIVTAGISEADNAVVVQVDTYGLDPEHRCRVYVNSGPVFDTVPEW
ncbi:hypothetical protein AB0I35_13010 [Nocardia sp. NPDC050378]|uniref:hypothetical protein n=1 Tax=Nocardia sp. NPDC050378 TaxID=3155400 RepID=UPI0033F304AB